MDELRRCPVCSTLNGVAYCFPFAITPASWPLRRYELLCYRCSLYAHCVLFPRVSIYEPGLDRTRPALEVLPEILANPYYGIGGA